MIDPHKAISTIGRQSESLACLCEALVQKGKVDLKDIAIIARAVRHGIVFMDDDEWQRIHPVNVALAGG